MLGGDQLVLARLVGHGSADRRLLETPGGVEPEAGVDREPAPRRKPVGDGGEHVEVVDGAEADAHPVRPGDPRLVEPEIERGRRFDEAVPGCLRSERGLGIDGIEGSVEATQSEFVRLLVNSSEGLVLGTVEIDPSDGEPEEVCVPRERLDEFMHRGSGVIGRVA